MSLYSDDRRKRKWDNQDSSPSKSRSSSNRDRDDRTSTDRDRDSRDRYDRYEDRHGSGSSSSHRDRRGDRRSASPPREPRKHSSSSSKASATPLDPAAAAAAAAARISASLGNRAVIPPTIPSNYGQNPLPPPSSSGPLAITAPPPPPPPSAPPPPITNPSIPAPPPPSIGVVVKKDERGPLGDIYQQDGEWMKDIEINNLRNRYLLTKPATQQQIKRDTGAGTPALREHPLNVDVSTRGKYYPDTALATERDPPLYLHIVAKTYPALERASRTVQELIDRDLGSLVDERRFRRTDERDEHGRRKWPEERIPIGMESVRGFNVRAQIVGPSGSYVKHISTETRTRVQIKGQNSGFLEPATQRESDEPTYLHITGPDEVEVQKAKALAVDLIETVRQAYEAHVSGVPPPSAVHYQSQQPAAAPPPQQMSPPGITAPPGTSYSVAPGAAAPSYGGAQGYQQYYGSYYGQGQPPPPPGTAGSPPPPGVAGNGYHQPANVISPPPPPGASSYGNGQYSAMPPPPGQ